MADLAPATSNVLPGPLACGRASATGRCAQCGARPFSVCAALPDAELSRLEALSETVALARGQALYRQDDPAPYVFNVSSGSLRLSRLLPDGRRQVLGFAFAGDFLELDRAAAYVCTAEAIEPSTVCRFSRPRFEALLAERRELAAALLDRTGDALAAAHAQVLLLGRKTALERVASFLLSLPACDPARPAEPGRLRLPMTRAEIADYLGLTLETVSRSLSTLKRRGVLRQLSLVEFELKNPEALAALAGDS